MVRKGTAGDLAQAARAPKYALVDAALAQIELPETWEQFLDRLVTSIVALLDQLQKDVRAVHESKSYTPEGEREKIQKLGRVALGKLAELESRKRQIESELKAARNMMPTALPRQRAIADDVHAALVAEVIREVRAISSTVEGEAYLAHAAETGDMLGAWTISQIPLAHRRRYFTDEAYQAMLDRLIPERIPKRAEVANFEALLSHVHSNVRVGETQVQVLTGVRRDPLAEAG